MGRATRAKIGHAAYAVLRRLATASINTAATPAVRCPADLQARCLPKRGLASREAGCSLLEGYSRPAAVFAKHAGLDEVSFGSAEEMQHCRTSLLRRTEAKPATPPAERHLPYRAV